ncbi:putative aminopeptidase-2 [Vespula maculifrons]|uniref:Aminopeptidase N n=1 Tax=Vespula maculifrons TaxID=7453 RepID=A0ABD2CRZ6_VESMC
MDCRRILFLFISLEIFLISGHTKDILEDEFNIQDDFTSENYRLPTTMHPTSYEIILFPNLTGNFSFYGEVKINITVDAPTKFIVFHQGNLFNINTSISAENKLLEIAEQRYDVKTEKYNIELKENLKVGNEILLHFIYYGFLRDDMIGFYKSSYMTNDNKLRWLAITQFQTTHARHAFPCFDEPSFKATFKISLIRSKEFNSISNMPLENTKQISSNLYLDTFKTTVPMSTYLVAFAIFDFHSLEVGRLAVWTRPDMIHQAHYASKIGSNTLTYMTNLFQQQYELPKMDMVAVPDFSAGAMENWGLITYRESRLLYNENESSIVSQQNVASVIIHEITHMWFGNLLTPSWWSYLWLSEGFARYFQYFGTAQIEKTWSMEDQFLVEQYQAALGFDGIETSLPLTREIINQSQVSGSGDSITYSKGASIIRMMSYIVGIDKFYEALRLYIRQNKNVGIVEPKNLWIALQKVIDSSHIDIETIMNSWTKKSGFPVLTVTIEKGKAKLHQKRFLLRNLKSTFVNETWSIPITYTTQKQTDFKSIEIKHWMKDEEKTINVDVSDSDWIVFNIQQAGFYRVNYDNASWYRIIDALKSDSFTKIHVYNRAGIIDDLLNLARTGSLDYRTALDGLQYLQQEKSYLPFKAAFRALDYLTQRFSGDEVNYVLYKKHVLSLIEGVYQTLGYVDRKKDDRLTVQLRQELNDLACKFGHEECVFSSLEYFRGWINAASRIEPNQRSAAYCMGVLYGNVDDWNYLWNHYKTSKVVSEQLVVLSALGCSNNTDILKQYLEYAISPYEKHRIHKQDSTSVFSTVYSSSLIGVNCVLEFVDKNHNKMAEYYGGYNTIASILSGASRYLSTQELINKFERLIKNHSEFTEIYKSLVNSLELAKYELIWYKKNVDHIVSWIKDNNKVPDDQDRNEYRLPGDVVPKKYILSLEPFLDPSNFTFSGKVQILAVTTKKTNQIVLHTSNITVYNVYVLVSNKEVNVKYYTDKNDFFVIKLEQTFDDKTEMNIVIQFTGELNKDMRGFYRSYYIDKNGKKRWLAATQLAPIGARRMFPCFDEPAMKAIFSVDVLVPYGYHAISNTKIIGIKDYPDTQKYWYTFEETKLMSTYLLALAVTDFNYMNDTINKKNYIAWTRPNALNEISYAFSLMEPFVKTYEQHLKHNYTLNKLDIIALSDLAYGAMENWGLITFREDKLLFHSNVSNVRVKQTVTTVLSHEIAHQWFGNLVSPLWWNYIWLNEGFATYFEYFGISYQKPEWELEWQFVVDKLHSAFKSDALASSHPMTYNVQSPTEIKNIYDSISYAKAASVIRMIEKTCGSDVFYAALRQYLEARKFNVATPDDLYAAISSQLPDQTSAKRINKFLDSWTTQVGYPVVNVTIDSSGWATLSQERFFLRNEKGESVDKIWQIPITWTSEKNPNFENTKPQFWLNYAEMRVMTDNNVGWKIFNVQQAGYYRVNYDRSNWKRIIDVLNTGKFEKIHKVNRAALIDDLMNLARAGYVDYDLVFSATEYLQYEEDYLPLRAFFNGFTYLHNKFEGQEIFALLKKHVSKITQMDTDLTAKISSKTFSSDMYYLSKMERYKWACKYKINYCFELALMYLKNPKHKVPVNDRPAVYCVWATKSVGWDILWQSYLNSTITSEKLVILNALGCSENTDNLNKLLSKATTKNSEIQYKDSTAVFASIYENSLTGVETVMKFMEMKFDDIYQYYNDDSAIKSIMSGLAERISTKQLYEQYTNLVDLIAMKQPTLKNSLKSYHDLVLYELDWYKRNKLQISYYLDKLYPNNSNRLPTILYPLNYNLSIAIKESRNFTGSVKINIRVDKPTFQIVLNAHKLQISNVDVYETPNDASDKNVKRFEILDVVQLDKSQKLIIYLKTYIEVTKVTVEMDFTGEINTQMKGLYQYNDLYSKSYNYLATYFKPNYARMVFPCFDEPAFKAKFKIHILRHNSYKSLSNTALERSLNFTDLDYTWDIYEESRIMSTYLLAFVISDFGPVRNGQERLNVWARKDIIIYGDEAQYTIYKLYRNTEYLISSLRKSEKVEIVGLLNFPVRAMENWGLFIFRESQLFYDPNIVPLSQYYSILTTMSHVISHEYFGNLVTCEWWSYSWLNEGLAQYFQWLIAEPETYRNDIKSMFVVNDMHDVLDFEDLLFMSHPVSAPRNLRESFDKISYKKGASIIRMLHMLIGNDNFYKAIKNYVIKNKNGTVNPSKLWEAFQPFMKNISLETTMNEWIGKSGYPIVSVYLNSSSGLLQFNQKNCMYITCTNVNFHIPISMATELNPNFENTTPQYWLKNKSGSIQTNLRNNWVVINVQQSGYYRVQYDIKLMNRIIDVLNSKDYGLIHVINRAQIIDDTFYLGKRNKISLSKIFEVSLYLREERAHLPWKAFERNINNLWEEIRDLGNNTAFKKYVLYLTDQHVKRLGFNDTWNEFNQFNKEDQLNRELILSLNCKFGGEACISQSKRYFVQSKKIPPNAKPAVLCTIIKNGNENTWMYLWSAYKKKNLRAEQILYLDALGCTENTNAINTYLSYIFNKYRLGYVQKEDIPRAFASIYKSSEKGWKECYEYIMNHYMRIYDELGDWDEVAELFIEIILRIQDNNILDKFKFFVQNNQKNLEPISAKLLAAVNIAEYKIIDNISIRFRIQMILEDILHKIENNHHSKTNSGTRNLNIVFLIIMSLMLLFTW